MMASRFGRNRLCGCIRRRWLKCKVVFLSLVYNDHCNYSYVVDTLMEPMIRFVDNYAMYLGPAFVSFLIGMMGMVIVVTYLVIVPYEWYRKSYLEIGFYFVTGHWILVNLLFHYSCAYSIKPGCPPVGSVLVEAVGMCKHCVSPKPPRTHHCRVCNRCILKMDHHCPWLNQCIGHYNHRYFYFTVFFMWMGCLFIVIGMWPAFVEHFWMEQDPVAPWCMTMNHRLVYARYLCQGMDEFSNEELSQKIIPDESVPAGHDSDVSLDPANNQRVGKAAQTCILFVFFTSSAVVVAIGLLLAWHTRLILRGETSIEQNINKQTRKIFQKEGKVYLNPYDFGPLGNVIRFLGLNSPDRSFWRHVLLPSRHDPVGDGLTWESATFQIRHDSDDVRITSDQLMDTSEVAESIVCV